MTDAPLPHPGTLNQIRLNRLTHRWHSLDGDTYRCLVCDANAYGVVADYPCGHEPPRTTGRIPVGKVPYETDGMNLAAPDLYEADTPDAPEWGRTP